MFRGIDPEKLGKRIAIIGPSGSGKSTLAQNLSDHLAIPCYHLDQIAHEPETAWIRRPDEEFVKDHNDIIAQDSWITDGNYSICMPQRFQRATSVIWVDPPLLGCIWRGIARAFSEKENRPGKLEGAKNDFSFALMKYTLTRYPKNRIRYKEILSKVPQLTVYHLNHTPF